MSGERDRTGSWTAVVAAGGRSTRLGRDKASTPLGERTLLEHVVAAIPDGVPVIVVGDDPGTLPAGVRVVREEPSFGGPVAALAAGLAHAETPQVVMLAVDMPFGPALADRLIAALDGHEAAVPVDRAGHWQQLVSAYRADALRRALDALPTVDGASMRAMLGHLDLALVPIEDDRLLTDIDTPDDLARAEAGR